MAQWKQFPSEYGWWWMRHRRRFGRRFTYEVVFASSNSAVDFEIRRGSEWIPIPRFNRAEFFGPIHPPDDENLTARQVLDAAHAVRVERR